jgi:hypothetical protein
MKETHTTRWFLVTLLILTAFVGTGFGPRSYWSRPAAAHTSAQTTAPVAVAAPQTTAQPVPEEPSKSLAQSAVEWLAQGVQALGKVVLGALTAFAEGLAKWAFELITRRTTV